MKSPQTVIDNGFQEPNPDPIGSGSRNINSNPITAPFHRGSKSGVDLDVVSSLRISHMDERFGHGSSVGGMGMGGGSRPVTSEMHHSLGRKGNRYHNPLDTDLDVEADDPARSLRDPSPSRSNRLDRVIEREEDVREGGEGDIQLNPFAESSQVSAASSYKDQREDDKVLPRDLGPGQEGGEREMPPRGRRPSFLVPEEERTPRPRNVKHLSSSSPETMRRLSNTSGSRRSAMGGKSGGETEGKEDGEAPVAARKKVKFDEAVVVKDDRARSDEEQMQREGTGVDEPEDSGLISSADGEYHERSRSRRRGQQLNRRSDRQMPCSTLKSTTLPDPRSRHRLRRRSSMMTRRGKHPRRPLSEIRIGR